MQTKTQPKYNIVIKYLPLQKIQLLHKMGNMSRQNITTRKRGIYVKHQQQTEMAFQVNNQKLGILTHRSIQPDTQI